MVTQLGISKGPTYIKVGSFFWTPPPFVQPISLEAALADLKFCTLTLVTSEPEAI